MIVPPVDPELEQQQQDQIRPVQRWLRGGRFSFKDTHDAAILRGGERVSDVRA